MKIFFVLIFFLILSTDCSLIPSHSKKQIKTDSSSQIQDNLERFIEDYNWQYNGNERRPVIAATGEELNRLKAAWVSSGSEHEILRMRFLQLDNEISNGINYPPEGGQHNQWYQCDVCQRGLVTLDTRHHKCPKCGNIFSGFPYDNVIYTHQHSLNFSIAESAAWAWAITGEKKYAVCAAGILSGYAERYLNYPMLHASVNNKNINVEAQKLGKYISAGHIMAQTLDEANLMIPAATAFDLIYDSKVLDKEEKKNIEDKLLRAMADCINTYKAGKSNWQTWHNAALLYAGAVIGDKQMVKMSILDDKNGFTTQMKISVMPEGMWYENSWGYHYYTLTAMTIIAEGCRRLGMDLYSNDLLRKMYLLPFDYQMADGSLPRFGDAVQHSPIVPYINEKAYAAYRDERLLATLSSDMTWDRIISGRKEVKKDIPIKTISKIIPGAGHAILATDGPGKLTAAITFGPYGGFHGHYDKLAFVFFGFGQELGVDPGRAASQAYRLPIHRDWYKATTGHNAVLVDGKSQNEAGGNCLAYEATPSYSAIVADAGPAYLNVTHHRFLLLSPTYLLVVDDLTAKDGMEHTFDWLYHNKSQNVSCSLTETMTKLEMIPPGYSYLKDIAAMIPDDKKHIEVTFLDENISTHLIMLELSGDEVFTATGPLSSVVDRVPMVIIRRRAQNVRFITLLEPFKRFNQQNVTGMSLIGSDSRAIRIVKRDGEDQITFTGEGLNNFSVLNITDSSDQTVVLKSETK